MDFDDVLQQYLGEFGRFQLLFMFFACSVSIHCGIATIEYVFFSASPIHTCHVTELNQYNFSNSEIEQFLSPTTDDGYDACSMYVRDYGNITRDDIETFLSRNQSEALQTTACEAWRYDDTIFSSTYVTEWNLVCGRRWLVAMSQSAYMTAKLFNSVSGVISDRFGRRPAVLVFFLGLLVGRLVTVLAPSVHVFVAARFLVGMCSIAVYTSVYVLGLELVGPRWRPMAGAVPYYWWLAGSQITVGLAYWWRDWRPLLIAGTVCVIPHLALFCWLPESPRWLSGQGRRKRSRDAMERMARVNKRTMPDSLFLSAPSEDSKSRSSVRDVIEMFRSWHFIKVTLIFILQWNATTLVYHGLMFYLPNIGNNPYISVTLSSLIEVPACVYSQLTMNTWLGRRINLSACFLFSGTALLSALIVPTESTWLLLTLAVLGKFGVSANWNIIYMITSEVYPTRMRSAGLAICSMAGRLGGVLSPFIAQLAGVHSGLPALVMGSLAVAAGLCALLLPETRGQHLEDEVHHTHPDRSGCFKDEVRLKEATVHSDTVL